MPIYEYECQACSKSFEQWQKISDEPLRECPKCSGRVKKLVSLGSFKLNGDGWYADGYSSKSEKPKAKSSKTTCGKACEATPKTTQASCASA